MRGAAAAAAAAAAFSCFCTSSSNASRLQIREKFFSQIAAGALGGALGPLAPQQQQFPFAAGSAAPAAAAATAPAAAETPEIPAVDVGLLETNKGAAALQVGGMLPDLAAPVIFMEPPPVTQSQTLEAAEIAETTLAQIGDQSSPAMKAVREYELRKLGEISGTTLEQIRKEIRETESAIEKRKKERNDLTNKLKSTARELAKSGNRQMELEATFANAEKEEAEAEDLATEMEGEE
ncbi:hypothetical protein, conserved [Eimeria tenella]|uniref:Uncharacterized protein n=1 Tax=Eimeria tenella TaxID=5802 RepID=U6L236_EIMTE|nr:hypothetical protein, conserved [Eimeria tenella]CDJ44246.1 hypothetical protein, conserved [Eimeria tenella]|eukprot:XP_013234995.1 hypothetical protein, conserved [Eimeria tenella]